MVKVKVSYILAFFIMFGFLIPLFIINKYMLSLVTIKCNFTSNRVTVGGRVDYTCYGKYSVSPGINTFIMELPGTKNIVESYISFTDVSLPTKKVNITGVLASGNTVTHIISIPSNAKDVKISAYIKGIPNGTIYPSGPYIHGGNYPLDCGVNCIYNSGVIIDRPGDYVLTVFGGNGGTGVEYGIYGSYTLTPPQVTVTINDQVIYNNTVSSIGTVNLVNLRKENIININVNGEPNFNVLFRTTVRCGISGGTWNCLAYTTGVSNSTIACSTNLLSDCDLNGVIVEAPFDTPYAKYVSDAKDIQVRLNGKAVSIDESAFKSATPEIVFSGLSEGTNTLDVTFTLPYVIPEAQKAFGSCAISPLSISASTFRYPHNFTLTIRNIGTSTIMIDILVPSYLSDKIDVIPSKLVIQPQESKNVIIQVNSTVSGNITIEGCSYKSIYIPINIRKAIEPVYIIIGISLAIFIISVLLLFRR